MDRWQWVDAFRKADISTATLMNMKEEDFQKCCLFLIDCGLAPLSYLPKNPKTPEEDELQRIIDEANKIKTGRETTYRYNPSNASKFIQDQKYNTSKTEPDVVVDERKSSKAEKSTGPKTYVWSEDDEAAAKRVIQEQQDAEYNRVLQEELAKQEAEKQKQLEEMKQNFDSHEELTNYTQTKRGNIEKASLMQDSPNGVQIALNLPSRKRLLHKFDIHDMGSSIVDLINGQEEMYDNCDKLIPYKVTFGIKQELNPDYTLDEQGLNKRSLLTVQFVD